MKTPRPSDRIEVVKRRAPRISERDRQRIVNARRENGAIEVRWTAAVRPNGAGAWRPINSATEIHRAYSAFNAEQIIAGGPTAGKDFCRTTDLLENYEQQNTKEKNT